MEYPAFCLADLAARLLTLAPRTPAFIESSSTPASKKRRIGDLFQEEPTPDVNFVTTIIDIVWYV